MTESNIIHLEIMSDNEIVNLLESNPEVYESEFNKFMFYLRSDLDNIRIDIRKLSRYLYLYTNNHSDLRIVCDRVESILNQFHIFYERYRRLYNMRYPEYECLDPRYMYVQRATHSICQISSRISDTQAYLYTIAMILAADMPSYFRISDFNKHFMNIYFREHMDQKLL